MNKFRMAMFEPSQGYLEIIIGPMYSGKTSRIIEIYNKFNYCNIPVAVINHNIDTRYDNYLLSTHDKVMIPCIKTSHLKNVWNTDMDSQDDCFNNNFDFNFENCKVVLINEGQFFEDLYEVVRDMVKKGKHVYVCGLDGDFERNKFGQILDLIPLCDNVYKMTALCSICKNGTKAIFSMRSTDDKIQTLVGSDIYQPVCRLCYETHVCKSQS